MISPGIISRGAAVSYDSDADAFFTAAGITDDTQKSAVNQLVLDLKSYSIWSKMKAVYPLVGGAASSHKYNLKDPRDLDAAFRISFGGSWTHSSNGAAPSGTSTYADTFLDAKTVCGVNDFSIGAYSRTDSTSTGNGWGMYYNGFNSETGATHPGFQTHWTINIGGNKYLSDIGNLGGGSGVRVTAANSTTLGLLAATRRSSSEHEIYKNGASLATGNPAGSGAFPTGSVYFSAVHRMDNGTFSGSDNRQIAFWFIATGLSDSEHSNLYTAVQAFQTTLGRNV